MTASEHTWPFGGLDRGAYRVILADAPWRFETWSAKGQGKSPSQHYAVMDFAAIAVLPVEHLAADDAMLVLWCTQNTVEQAFRLMRAWGFEPKTLGAWAKQSPTGSSWAFGTGYLLRSAAEFFLLGTCGKPRQAARNVRNLIVAPVREHSRKPDELHQELERMFPGARRCELFARRVRPGWDCWGDELTKPCSILAGDDIVAMRAEDAAFDQLFELSEQPWS